MEVYESCYFPDVQILVIVFYLFPIVYWHRLSSNPWPHKLSLINKIHSKLVSSICLTVKIHPKLVSNICLTVVNRGYIQLEFMRRFSNLQIKWGNFRDLFGLGSRRRGN